MHPPIDSKLPRVGTTIFTVMSRLAAEHGAINLSQGFPDFDPPEELLKALEKAARGPCHQYAVTWGAPNFRQALARKIQRFSGLEIDPDQHLVVTCGSTEAMMAAMMTAATRTTRMSITKMQSSNTTTTEATATTQRRRATHESNICSFRAA